MKLSDEELKKRKDIAVKVYLETGNWSEAARQAGYSPKSASKRGYDLSKDPYVAEKVRKYQSITKDQSTDANLGVDDILESNIGHSLRVLAEKAREGDIQAAKYLADYKLKHEKAKGEVLGELEGLSTTEIIRRVDDQLQETKALLERAVEAFGTKEVPGGSDLSI